MNADTIFTDRGQIAIWVKLFSLGYRECKCVCVCELQEVCKGVRVAWRESPIKSI